MEYRPRHLMSSVKAIVKEASLVPVYLPNISALKEALVKAHDWSSKVDHVQVNQQLTIIDHRSCKLQLVKTLDFGRYLHKLSFSFHTQDPCMGNSLFL